MIFIDMNLQENITRIKEVMGIQGSVDNNTEDVDIWYHGSTNDISQDELNPLHRESSSYKSDTNKLKWSSTGSARGGVGIYFGRNKKDRGPEGPMTYTEFDNTSAPYTKGFMYEMKLKPTANIKNYSALHNINKELYNKLREEGVDALVFRNELNLLNPDAVDYFNKIMYWKNIPVLYELDRGKRTDKIEFDNNGEMENYLEQELGQYKIHELGNGKKLCLSNSNPDSEKVFEFTEDRKWFDL